MDKYAVEMLQGAIDDLDRIYTYITNKFKAPDTAIKYAEKIENAILSLENLPHRGSYRKTGLYSDAEYRQILVNNYTIVYRVDDEKKKVIIVTVRYSPSVF